ncbi:hypothetical protein ACFPYM_23475, partial [Methylobacterium hispanicum]
RRARRFERGRAAAAEPLARLLPETPQSWHGQVRGIEPMQDGALLLHLLHAALMAASMMLTWQVHRLRKPAAK